MFKQRKEDALADYSYRRTVSLPFAEAVTKVKDSLAKEGFGIQAEIDLARAMREKLGVEFEAMPSLPPATPSSPTGHTLPKRRWDSSCPVT